MATNLKIGCHVSMSGPDYILGSVNEALSYDGSALMLYTGAPQNSKRVPVEKLKINEGIEKWKANGFDNESIIVHAPYIINLANTIKPETYEISKQVLQNEIYRTEAIGAKYLVLHPGAHLTASVEEGINSIAKGLNETDFGNVSICLETMAGKGSEVGRTFEELAEIISKVNKPVYVCLDTCHINDAGYDLENFDDVLKQFDEIVGLDKLKVLHINDSKNIRGSHSDRHANIGEGTIGGVRLKQIVHHPLLDGKVFILETPYKDGAPIYKEEIAYLRG